MRPHNRLASRNRYMSSDVPIVALWGGPCVFAAELSVRDEQIGSGLRRYAFLDNAARAHHEAFGGHERAADPGE